MFFFFFLCLFVLDFFLSWLRRSFFSISFFLNTNILRATTTSIFFLVLVFLFCNWPFFCFLLILDAQKRCARAAHRRAAGHGAGLRFFFFLRRWLGGSFLKAQGFLLQGLFLRELRGFC